jgi:hypoxanthine phosphoribosyltransferase
LDTSTGFDVDQARAQAQHLLQRAELLCGEADVARALNRVAGEISARLAASYPLVLAVANGALVFAGELLPRLSFALEFEVIRVSRYRDQTTGGALNWLLAPQAELRGRSVLVLDDILDEGMTLHAIREHVMRAGAQAFYSAVLVDKHLGRPKPMQADFVGLQVPDRYVFGCGMDVKGYWRNLPAIYALKEGG